MNNLFVQASRKKAAGCKKLAVFFLVGLISCASCYSSSKTEVCPFIVDGQLYNFSIENDRMCNLPSKAPDIRAFQKITQRSVSNSKKNGCFLCWNKELQKLMLVDKNYKVQSKIDFPAASVFLNEDFILSQNSFFSENRGFEFTLYKIKYPRFLGKIGVKQVWHGFIDCFVSDCFFTNDGVCICGGNREDSKHFVFYITQNGIHNCYSTQKNEDFLRIINNSDNNKVYSFVSGRDKSKAESKITVFSIDNGQTEVIELNDFENFPEGFDCFFGYGFFYNGKIVLPASVNQILKFLSLDLQKMVLTCMEGESYGCIFPLKSTVDGFFYVARDALVPNSYHGLALFDGTESVINLY